MIVRHNRQLRIDPAPLALTDHDRLAVLIQHRHPLGQPRQEEVQQLSPAVYLDPEYTPVPDRPGLLPSSLQRPGKLRVHRQQIGPLRLPAPDRDRHALEVNIRPPQPLQVSPA
ncbi:MAG: hypothetical protein RIG82_09215 [Phycisphaeraceae bacterium]